MYDPEFLKSKLGKTAIGCVAVMAVFALSSQMQVGPDYIASLATVTSTSGGTSAIVLPVDLA